MGTYVFDIETDGLDPSVIHCLSYQDVKTGDVGTHTSIVGMIEFLESTDTLIGHNIIRYDMVVLKKLLGYEHKGSLVDTLGLSWYLWPNRGNHGLEGWGTTMGIKKPEVKNWVDGDIQLYVHRCEEDVKINTKVYFYLMKKLNAIYKKFPDQAQDAINFMNFKLDCAREQEEVRWKLDVPHVKHMADKLSKLREEKVQELKPHMPKNPVYSVHNKPKNIHKADGTLSVAGQRWMDRLREHKLPMTHCDPVKFVDRYEEPNPGSPVQVKEWLFSLGWEPRTFDYKKDDNGGEREIPQVRDGGHLCDSVIELADKHPEVKILEGLTVLNHRLSIFNNMIKYQRFGYLKAGLMGLTNTLRFRHANPLVNLPGVDKPYGKEIRGALVANQGQLLCGADLSSLEATTKAHYIYPYDKDYALELTHEDFDEHLDLAVQSGSLSIEDYRYYAEGHNDDRHNGIHNTRKKFKPVNYSAVYGIGAPKLSRGMGNTQAEAQELLDAYWERNKAVKQFAESMVKHIVRLKNGEMWIRNPVSKLYYSLRYEKDIFSTINQGTGAYVFDTWVKHSRDLGVRFCGQFHDEHISPVLRGNEGEHEKKLQEALDKTNKELKLNVVVGMDCQFGTTYADIH